MTAVIDIPDDLYQKVSARLASLGLRVPEVTVELYELEEWFHSADEALSRAPAGPSALELLMQDRNRLEKP
jgi:hypothetical protein